MATMTVGDLMLTLEKLDPNMPLHKFGNIHGCPPIDSEFAGYVFQKMELMESRSEPGYFANAADPMWSKQKRRFKKPFVAAVIG